MGSAGVDGYRALLWLAVRRRGHEHVKPPPAHKALFG
jgi:hypothetical protein